MTRLYGPAPGEPPALIATDDLAGLSTADVEGRPVGGLVGTLSEKRTGLIRYLDIGMADEPKHVLVPIGHARFERNRVPPRLQLRAATYEDLLSIPSYDGDPSDVDATFQDRVLAASGRLFYGSRYYAHPSFDHGAIYVGEHPIEGPDAAAGEGSPLRPLSALSEFRLARGEPDIRGWKLCDARGEDVGEVTELLVEPSARKVRYAVVALDDPAREAALPIGYVDVGETAGRLTTPVLERDDIRVLPPYEPPLDRPQETRIHATLDSRLSGSRTYERLDFREG